MYTLSLALFLGFWTLSRTENHPCFRKCSVDPSTVLICHFNFTLSNNIPFKPLSPRCGQCPLKREDCRPGCIPIPADGKRQGFYMVNDKYPGPWIRVCQGDTVIVNVTNNLIGEDTGIHWHGIHQKETPWMDGVPFVTQCPIKPKTTFTYEFNVPLCGTYFWHSHYATQRNGIVGGLIVRCADERNVHRHLYDFDLSAHEMLLQDCLPSLPLLGDIVEGIFSMDTLVTSTILVNGKGVSQNNFPGLGSFRPEEFLIQSGKSYRFRVINNGITNCPIEISVESHKMTVIATDGFDVKPMEVDSLGFERKSMGFFSEYGTESTECHCEELKNPIVMFAGERWDFVLTGNQPIASYWMKFRGLLDCNMTRAFQVAVLKYVGVPSGNLPAQPITSWEDAGGRKGGLQVNTPGAQGIKVTQLKSMNDDDPEILTQETADHQFYLEFDSNIFHNIQNLEGIPLNVWPQLNFLSMKMPSLPPLVYLENLWKIPKCDSETEKGKNCKQLYCSCTHWLKVKLNSIVEFVMVDRGYKSAVIPASHPFHLHGHSFRVMGEEQLRENGKIEPSVVQERDAAGLINRTRSKAPIKDMMPVPNGGYAIFRFRANNPGFWLFHCHIELHTLLGMSLILQVGDLSEIPRAPKNFPKCGGQQQQPSNSLLPIKLPLLPPLL